MLMPRLNQKTEDNAFRVGFGRWMMAAPRPSSLKISVYAVKIVASDIRP